MHHSDVLERLKTDIVGNYFAYITDASVLKLKSMKKRVIDQEISLNEMYQNKKERSLVTFLGIPKNAF